MGGLGLSMLICRPRCGYGEVIHIYTDGRSMQKWGALICTGGCSYGELYESEDVVIGKLILVIRKTNPGD